MIAACGWLILGVLAVIPGGIDPEGARGGGGGIPAATLGLTLVAAAAFRCGDFANSAARCASAAFWARSCLICSLDCNET